MLLRPQAVVLCSSGPCEVSEKFPFSLRAMQGERKVNIMQITGKKGGEVGAGRENKGWLQRFYCIFELPFQWNRNFDWSPTCQSINKKKIHCPKGVQFSWRLFAAHGKQTRSVNCTPVSKWKPRSSRNLNYILGQNISSFHTIGISVHNNERTIYFK